jgi:hypothetical protein
MHVELLEPAQAPDAGFDWRPWLGIAVLVVGNPLLHKPISDVCDVLRVRWGFASYDRVALTVIPLVTVVAGIPLLLRSLPYLRRASTLWSFATLAVITVASQQWLFVANIELIHFSQFALLAGLLLAAALSGPSAYIAATVSGLLDETYQHFVIYPGVPGTYFDINDIVLNAIGSA